MKPLECAGSDVCRQYCLALDAQGVEVAIDDEAGCNVPAMFEVSDEGISFDPKPRDADLRNPEIVDSLGGALCGVLIERTKNDSEREIVDDLITTYGQAFSAQLNIWQAMLGATRDGRKFTDVELTYYQQKRAEAEQATLERAASAPSEVVLRARAASDHHIKAEHKLLFDEQMTAVVDRLVSNLMDSKPTLLVGDKGIAKTQATKLVAKLFDPTREPIIISGHGDMMSNELIGGMEQDKDTRVFRFKEGKIPYAMRMGLPVIIDEANVSDQPVMMRLQDLLLRRPGEQVIIQENGGDSIEIKPGFVVFATANEASARYQHRSVLDPAFRDRYDVIQMRYPDSKARNPLTEIPSTLMRLALASAVDGEGNLAAHIDLAELEKLVRLAHITQHLYSVPARNARVNITTGQATSNFLDDEPTMTDCITPRTLDEVVGRCSDGNKPGMTLKSEMERAIVSLDQAGSTTNQDYARKALTLLGR